MARTFTLSTDYATSAAVMFDASLSIDAHLTSMSQTRETAVGGVTSGLIGLGETVTWRARHLGFWFTMTSEITALERPRRFVDEQVSGPFRAFAHEHLFEEIPGGCRMTDTITVGSPILGFVVDRLVLVPYLRRLIRRRNASLAITAG